MRDTVKLVIEIPKEDYEFTKGAKTARSFPSEYYVKLILNGKTLDSVLDEIRAEIESQRKEAGDKHSEDDKLQNYYFGLNDGLKDARDTIDKHIEEGDDEE